MAAPLSLAHHLSVVVVALGLVLTAWLPAMLPWLPLPAGVLEMALGAWIGPQGLHLVSVGPFLTNISAFGMGMLFLVAGLEIQPDLLRGKPLQRALTAWFASAGLAVVVAMLLVSFAGFDNLQIVALALTTTALGILMPVLRDRTHLPESYARTLISVATLGEVAPTVIFSLLLAGQRAPEEATILVAFGSVSILGLLLVRRHQSRWEELFEHTMQRSAQLPTRLVVGALILMVVLNNVVQINLALGGLVLGLLVREGTAHRHRLKIGERLDGLGQAFAIPLFFIVSGMQLDVRALAQAPSLWGLVPLLALAMLLVRGLPVWLLLRKQLSPRSRLALALDNATQLPLVVAMAVMARQAGLLTPPDATVLVAAAALTVLLFPALATVVLEGDRPLSTAELTGSEPPGPGQPTQPS
ncbi:cation:proton antiporter [Synechococcus sp. CCY9201]|uniref:cation:proton antiporter n=1 Tax=Synechococcus sp. CCY9201 TaxID=174697 RepID=UPI002B1E9ADB|nr:cation:proton antiporter [Synechococcus sp. CCY9201]MEA5473985.1 cation:proton antiporter [Synechococcus sp. CCY9201]